MRPLSFRLPAHLGIAGFLIAVILPLFPLPAAAASGVSLTVHVGYQDVIKSGEWMPVTVDAHNAGSPVDGVLQVQESLNAQPGVSGLTLYQEPISLATSATKRVRVFVEMDNVAATVSVRLVQNGRLVAGQDSATRNTTNYLIGVLSDQSTTLDEFAAVHPASIAARVVHLQPGDLPDSAIPLRAFDILAIDDFASDGLTAAQRSAISDFVSAGGDLLLGSGAAWHKTLAGLPPSLMPMHVTGTGVVDNSAFGTSAVELATGTITSGQVWLAQDGEPLIIERQVGAGTVTLATFDWNAAPVAVSGSFDSVLRQVLSRAVFGSGGSGQNFSYAVGAFGGGAPTPFGMGGSPTVVGKSSALTPVLGNLPGLDLPSFQLTAALVLLYVLIVGPVNYLVLRAIRRRALAWITVPLIAIVASAGAYGAGLATRGRSVQINQVALIHVQPGSDRSYQENYTGVIPPSRGDYVAAIDSSQVLISPIINNYSGSALSNPGLRVDLPNNAVTLSGMTAFSLSGFATEGMTNAPRVTAHFRIAGGVLTGTIENHSNLAFTDGVLIAGDAFSLVPELKPGATVTATVTPRAASAVGQPLFMRIYGSGQYVGPYNVSSADRDTSAKQQLLSMLPTGGSFKGTTAFVSPMVVLWTKQSFQHVTVNGNQPRSTAMSAVVLSLPVDQIGTGSLPAGVVNSRIVDVVGDSQGNGPPGMVNLQNGSVTFEFAPSLAAGTRLTGVAVSSQNLYAAKFAGAPGSTAAPGIAGEYWDWTTSSWTKVNYQDGSTTSLPDSAVNPLTGVVRVRVTSTNGAFIAGSLTLAGTVR